jgi:integrase
MRVPIVCLPYSSHCESRSRLQPLRPDCTQCGRSGRPAQGRDTGDARLEPGTAPRLPEHVQDDRLHAAWLLLTTTGMRRGEVAGLRWVDVDLDVGRVSPRRPRAAPA